MSSTQSGVATDTIFIGISRVVWTQNLQTVLFHNSKYFTNDTSLWIMINDSWGAMLWLIVTILFITWKVYPLHKIINLWRHYQRFFNLHRDVISMLVMSLWRHRLSNSYVFRMIQVPMQLATIIPVITGEWPANRLASSKKHLSWIFKLKLKCSIIWPLKLNMIFDNLDWP